MNIPKTANGSSSGMYNLGHLKPYAVAFVTEVPLNAGFCFAAQLSKVDGASYPLLGTIYAFFTLWYYMAHNNDHYMGSPCVSIPSTINRCYKDVENRAAAFFIGLSHMVFSLLGAVLGAWMTMNKTGSKTDVGLISPTDNLDETKEFGYALLASASFSFYYIWLSVHANRPFYYYKSNSGVFVGFPETIANTYRFYQPIILASIQFILITVFGKLFKGGDPIHIQFTLASSWLANDMTGTWPVVVGSVVGGTAALIMHIVDYNMCCSEPTIAIQKKLKDASS